jgi:hypothetical protein
VTEKITAYATLCFPDDTQQQWTTMRDLFDLLVNTEGMPSDVIINLVVEEDRLQIHLDKGIQLISIPMRYIHEALHACISVGYAPSSTLRGGMSHEV